MKKTLAIGGKLALICAISAILLAFVNSITEPAIREYKRKTLLEGLKAVAGGGEIGEENLVEDNPAVKGYYPLVFPDGGSGYILRLIGSGYGGDMLILSGFRESGEIFSVKLMENQETPGLGKNAEKPAYMAKFIGKGGQDPVPTRKDRLAKQDADAVTGATITFLAVSKSLAEGSRFAAAMGGK